MSRTIVELSHPIHDNMDVYPGLPRPRIGLHRDHASSRHHYQGCAEFAIGSLELVGNTGTYLDSPYHRDTHGADVSQLPLDRLVSLPTVVIDATGHPAEQRAIDLALPAHQMLVGHAVLFRTGWDRHWQTAEYFHTGPYLGPATLQQLLHHRPALVGVDFCNVDDPHDPKRPVHTQLLRAGIPIVEHLRDLDWLPPEATTSFVPLAIRGAPSLPIRAFAIT